MRQRSFIIIKSDFVENTFNKSMIILFYNNGFANLFNFTQVNWMYL